MIKIFLSVVVFLALAQGARSSDQPQLVQVPVQVAYVPQAFDSNDNVQFMVEGELPSPCHRLGPMKTDIDKKTGEVKIEQWAYFHNISCQDRTVPFKQEVSVGILNKGRYKVLDSKSRSLLAGLPIQKALRAEPDEFLYATVRDAYVLPEGSGPRIARVEGFLSDTCSRIQELRVLRESATVQTILPIVEKVASTGPCLQVLVPFVKDVRMPQVGAGRHLLHVRSLNGQAVIKLFDVSPKRFR